MELDEHEWPDSGEHVWGKWMSFDGPPRGKFTQYRTCVHPDCNAHEEREVPM